MTVRKVGIVIFIALQLVLLGLIIRMYVGTRLKLMEAQNLIIGLLVRDTYTKKQMLSGADTNWIAGRLSTNQEFELKYIIRRNVMHLSVHAFIDVGIRQGDINLKPDELKSFEAYSEKYRRWAGEDHGDFKCRIPIVDQIEMVFYNRWADRMEHWLTKEENGHE
jgi:hypothetical protein